MTLRFFDLDEVQRDAMDRLTAGYRACEVVGCELQELTEQQTAACRELVELQLVATSGGWLGTTWFKLTLRGWALRAHAWTL